MNLTDEQMIVLCERMDWNYPHGEEFPHAIDVGFDDVAEAQESGWKLSRAGLWLVAWELGLVDEDRVMSRLKL